MTVEMMTLLFDLRAFLDRDRQKKSHPSGGTMDDYREVSRLQVQMDILLRDDVAPKFIPSRPTLVGETV